MLPSPATPAASRPGCASTSTASRARSKATPSGAAAASGPASPRISSPAAARSRCSARAGDRGAPGRVGTARQRGSGAPPASPPWRGRVDDVRRRRLALSAAEVARLADGQAVAGLADLLKVPAEQRTDAQNRKLRETYLDTAAP